MNSKKIREYLATELETLDIGSIHSRNRLPKTKDQFDALFQYDGRIQAWIVTRVGLGVSNPQAQNFFSIPETYVITTFMGFQDSQDTESVFEENINIVYEKLIRDKTLGGNVANVRAIYVENMTVAVVSEILSHYAEIHVDVETYC